MSLTDFLSPVAEDVILRINENSPRSLIHNTTIFTDNFPDLTGAHIAIIGVEDDRFQKGQKGCSSSADEIRKQFYRLVKHKHEISLVDLGNIKAGASTGDTEFALKACIEELIKAGIVPIILGVQDLGFAQFSAYKNISQSVQMVTCDSEMDLKENESEADKSSYLYRIISNSSGNLFNITHLAGQNYFIEQEALDAFDKMDFDLVRLGSLRANMQHTEPVLRNADMFIFSMNSVKASNAPGSVAANPNGLNAEDACQIMRYAGMGNDLTSLGLFDINPVYDRDHCTSKLAAQMLWYFIDGYYSRMNDYPVPESKDYMIYRTSLKSFSHEIVFYKHVISDRWWMEVPYPNEKSKHKGMFMVPCTYADYQLSQKDEVPDRWLKAYHKLM